jgi:RNA polymerase sigma-70 factor (ECF subfamily)
MFLASEAGHTRPSHGEPDLNEDLPAHTDGSDPDGDLLPGLAGGDERAFEQLVDRHLGRLHAAASRLLNDRSEAEDVCQDVFLQAWKHAIEWRPGRARFATWLHQVMLNACRDRLRRRRPQTEIDPATLIDPSHSPEQVFGNAQRETALQTALADLPERQREAVILCHYGDLSQAEAAASLGISVDALESLLARARRQLRLRLTPPPTEGDNGDRRATDPPSSGVE